MAETKGRETALITFLATAANITLLGVGGAFWGLVAGLVAYVLIHGKVLKRHQRCDIVKELVDINHNL